MVTLQSKQSPAQIIAGLDSQMWKHYYEGGGCTFDLGARGLLSEFRSASSVRDSVRTFRRHVVKQATDYAFQVFRLDRGRPATARQSYRQRLTYDVTRDGKEMFGLGNGYLHSEAQCEFTFNWDVPQFGLYCAYTFKVRDRFVDALDVFDWFPGNQELPSGKAFAIVARWDEEERLPVAYFR